MTNHAIILWNSVPICGGGAYSLHLASAIYLSLHPTFYFFTRLEITKWRICEHSSRYEVNNSIKLLILYGFFVLKKNYFFTFTAYEYDGLIVDGHNMIFFANKSGKWNPWLWFFGSSIRFVVTIYIDISCPFMLFSRIPSLVYLKTWIIVKFCFNNLGNERNLIIES